MPHDHGLTMRASADGLSAILEITLDRQGAEHLDAFEARVAPDAAMRSPFATICPSRTSMRDRWA